MLNLTTDQKREVASQFVDIIVDGMDIKSLVAYVTDHMNEYYESCSTDELQEEIKKHQENISHLLEKVTDKDEVPKRLLKMENLEQQLKGKIKTIEKDVKFYENNDTCPSCKQDIEQHHKECIFEERGRERAEVEIGIENLVEQINHTEARLAREAEIAYTSLSMVTDYDCWHEGFGNVSVEMVVEKVVGMSVEKVVAPV